MSRVNQWPFETLPPDRRTPLHRDQINFMIQAYEEGFTAGMGQLEFFAGLKDSRNAVILQRGMRGPWEVRILTASAQAAVFQRLSFADAAEDVMQWLRHGKINQPLEGQ